MTEDEPAISEPLDLSGLPRVVISVQNRHPLASPALVQRCIDDAVQGFKDARVRQYLLILIERQASDAVRDATGVSSSWSSTRETGHATPGVVSAS